MNTTKTKIEEIVKKLQDKGFEEIYPEYNKKEENVQRKKEKEYSEDEKPILPLWTQSFEDKFKLDDILVSVRMFRWFFDEGRYSEHPILTSVTINIYVIHYDWLDLKYQLTKIDYDFKFMDKIFKEVKNEFTL
jgi:hypothetical protein